MHHLQREFRPFRLHRVDEVAGRLDTGIEAAPGQVVRVGRVAGVRRERADVAHRAFRPHRVGKRKPLGGVVEIGLPLRVVRRDQVPPDADLGDDHVLPGEGFLDGGDPGGVADRDLRTVGGAVAEGDVRLRQRHGVAVAADGKAVAAEPDHGAGSKR